jgi:hypothetical protein
VSELLTRLRATIAQFNGDGSTEFDPLLLLDALTLTIEQEPTPALPSITFGDDAGDSFIEFIDRAVGGGYIVKLNGTDVKLVDTVGDLVLFDRVDGDGIVLTGSDVSGDVAYADIETIHVY